MPIVNSSAAPAIGVNALMESRSAHAARATASVSDAGGQPAAPAQASAPIPVYAIAPDILAQGADKALPAARHAGWRVLTTGIGESQVVDVDLTTHRPLSVRRGASAEILARAGSIAERAAADGATYEPRILDFGRLGLSALWLHSEERPDLFVTLEAEPKETSEATLLGEATRRARERLDTNDRGGAQGEVSDVGG